MENPSTQFKGLTQGFLALVLLMILSNYASAQTCVQAPSGLVGWWPGDNNANDIAGINHGTLQNGATFSSGMVSQAFTLDGVDDFVEIPDASSLHIPGSLSVDAWIRISALSGLGLWNIVSKENTSLNGDARAGGVGFGVNYNFHVVNSQLFFALTFDAPTSSPGCDAGGCFVQGSTLLTPGVNYHVAGVYDDTTKSLRVYLNGTLDGQRSFSTTGVPRTNAQPMRIGKRNAQSTNTVFPGSIDEVELFNRALTVGEISSIYSAGNAGKCKFAQVGIDIKPGSFPNSINLGSAGVVPVAILSNPSFDATQIDPATVTLAGAAVKLIGKGSKYSCSPQYVNEDGQLDLVCNVETAQFMIEAGDTIATLEAMTFSGRPIRGSDSINIVP